VLAPAATRLTLVLDGEPATGEYPMARISDDGLWEAEIPGIGAGQRYGYRIDGGRVLPDPAARFQPLGVHGPSEVVDPAAFTWTDAAWSAVAAETLVVYELHTGTFSPSGTFAGVRDKLPYLRDLGVTAIELMPVADFAGSRNWGYDGVALYAPSRAYGRPDDLRALVDEAHRIGLAVILDVVYNHLGPEGAYLPTFNPGYLIPRQTPWGAAVNLEGPGSAAVRSFIIDNANHWILEYHVDGLRLDATHALVDSDRAPFLGEFSRAIRAASTRTILLHAEDSRNLNEIVHSESERGWGFDAVWSDDFHHAVRTLVAGDRHGYYADFAGTIAELVTTLRQGWLFTGAPSTYLGRPRGTDPAAIPMSRFIVCLQNHDQIGNRPLGDRLHHQVDAATWRAASVLLLTAPMTPLLFMGQEWAASTPFQFFTDLEPGLGRMVTDGRRHEFRDFPEFSAPGSRERIPDPQALSTFEASTLQWDEQRDSSHGQVLALYRALLALRNREPAFQASAETSQDASALDEDTLVIRRGAGGRKVHVIVRLRGEGETDVELAGFDVARVLLTTEDPRFASDPRPFDIAAGNGRCRIRFSRPGAIIVEAGGAS
jgi:maltooligosyltrehalose trehalohydrolase